MKCIIYEKECIGCRECKTCDLSPDKECDNCCKCIDDGKDYNVLIAEVDASLKDAYKGKKQGL